MERPAVFIDRDGTINEQMGYINHISRLVLLPMTAEAIKLLNEQHYLVIVVSNQSGVARGYFPIDLVNEVHETMQRSLMERGALIDSIFFCPHFPQGEIKEYAIRCDCRKPMTGMIDQARKSFDIDMESSYVIGDHYTDIELARRAGLKGILVRTGYGRGEEKYTLPNKSFKPIHVADDLFDGVRWIIERNNI